MLQYGSSWSKITNNEVLISKLVKLGASRLILFFCFVVFTPNMIIAQTKQDLFSLIDENKESEKLLPDRMVFTQKIF